MAAPLALYPMVEETEARERVAAVYAAALEEAPFVPSLLKSLALCPPYLVQAWEQLAPVLGSDALQETADALAESVREATRPPADPADRAQLAEFIGPLGRMLLAAAGLRAALDGELHGVAPAAGVPPPPPAEPLAPGLPTAAELDAEALFGDIRARLGTPIVNSIWRKMAADGRLARVWEQLGPQAEAVLAPADSMRDQARAAAPGLPWRRAADEAALAAAGVPDAAPGMRAVLDAYLLTLPRVLALVASSAGR